MKYYKMKNVSSVTFVDTSVPMLEIARQAFHSQFHLLQISLELPCQHPIAHHREYISRSRFLVRDAAAEVRTASGDKFDTVVQTMGICSHHSPVKLLQSLGDACKPDGTIILLEHGRSHYDWLNRILDRYADKHADTWGCWWNRDIEGIVSQSGLRINKLKRYHFGTTYWIEAQPALPEAIEVKEEPKQEEKNYD